MNSPPKWIDIFQKSFASLEKAINSPELNKIVKKAEKDYVCWDTFKHYALPAGCTHEEACAYLKFARMSNRERTPIRAEAGGFRLHYHENHVRELKQHRQKYQWLSVV